MEEELSLDHQEDITDDIEDLLGEIDRTLRLSQNVINLSIERDECINDRLHTTEDNICGEISSQSTNCSQSSQATMENLDQSQNAERSSQCEGILSGGNHHDKTDISVATSEFSNISSDEMYKTMSLDNNSAEIANSSSEPIENLKSENINLAIRSKIYHKGDGGENESAVSDGSQHASDDTGDTSVREQSVHDHNVNELPSNEEEFESRATVQVHINGESRDDHKVDDQLILSNIEAQEYEADISSVSQVAEEWHISRANNQNYASESLNLNRTDVLQRLSTVQPASTGMQYSPESSNSNISLVTDHHVLDEERPIAVGEVQNNSDESLMAAFEVESQILEEQVRHAEEHDHHQREERSSDNEDEEIWVHTESESEESEDEAVSPEQSEVERPLVLRRQTSFQRELADAIVRLAPIAELEFLLRCGARVSEPVTQGLTPLHYAVWQRYPEAADLLIREGCDLNACDDIGYTPLHLCAEHGYLDMMGILLSHNALVNINHPDDEDLYPIDAVDEPLRLALKHDQIKAAKILLENNANPNGRYFFGSEINLVSPLKTELLELLLSWGASPNTRDRHGFTPIMKACHMQQEAEEALEERGSILGKDILMHFAQTLKGIESVLVLISHGADINLRTDARHEYRSVLHYAILSGSSPIVNLLIKQGAKVNLEPEYNRASPLHLAVLKGDTNLINMLLDADAQINITTPTVGSPLHVACSEEIPNRMEVLQLLLEKGANPNIVVRNESGRLLKPPLGEYLANCPDHNVDVVKLMLRYGTRVVMQAPQQSPLGLLNCLYTVAKNKEVMIELLEAAQKFDISLLRKTPLLVPSGYRDLFLEVAASPQSLRHLARVFIRQVMPNRRPEAVHNLALPALLQQYLLYEIN